MSPSQMIDEACEAEKESVCDKNESEDRNKVVEESDSSKSQRCGASDL